MRDAAAYVGGGGVLSAAQAAIVPPRQPRSPLAPPAPVFGMAWSVLFAGFGLARGRLRASPGLQREIDLLWLLCVAYPLYTGGMRWRRAAFAGNAVIAGLAGDAALRAARTDRAAARLLAPVLPWVAYATLILATDRP